jgi:aminomethyltransferase
MVDLTTPLHAWHKSHGARMAAFGGYDMPLWYASAKDEHLAVLTAAGVFDTSHMAAVAVEGRDAFDLLQYMFTNDLEGCIGPQKAPLTPGRAVYGAFLNEQGHVIDDAIVFMLAAEAYLVVVNAGMGAAVAGHLDTQGQDLEVQVKDLTGRFGKIDVQGPAAARILQQALEAPQAVLTAMPYFAFKGGFSPRLPACGEVRLQDGTAILLSRTGYTGEFGFEIFTPLDRLEAVWEMLLEAGAGFGARACGLAARDSLRAGAVLPLSHQDIGGWPFVNHPWPFALPYNADGQGFRKTFLGDRALRAAADAPHTLPFVGEDLRKVSLPAEVKNDRGETIGRVLTCVSDMAIGRHGDRIFSIASPARPADFVPAGLSCGFVYVNTPLAVGAQVLLEDKRRKLAVRIAADIRPDRTARKSLQSMM